LAAARFSADGLADDLSVAPSSSAQAVFMGDNVIVQVITIRGQRIDASFLIAMFLVRISRWQNVCRRCGWLLSSALVIGLMR